MTQRIISFFISQATGARHLKRSTRFFRLALMMAILAVSTLVCGLLVSFKVALQMWLFLLAVAVPLVAGMLIISRYFASNQKLSLFLMAGLISFVFFEFSLLGMLMDERAANFSWQYILSVAVIIGISVFIFSILVSLFYSSWFRALNSPNRHDE